MSLKPLDLQNLFVRQNEISKQQAARQEAAVHTQQVAGEEIEKETREIDERVAKTEEAPPGPESLKDDEQRGNSGQSPKKRRPNDGEDEDGKKPEQDIFRDPDLGNRIDING